MRKARLAFELGALSLAGLALGEKLIKSLKTCELQSCQIVQHSSFSEVWGVPITVFAVFGLFLAFILDLRKREKLSAAAVGLFAGAEAYLTFLELFYLQTVCSMCALFFAVLLSAFLLHLKNLSLKAFLEIPAAGFLFAHFIFFFPQVSFKTSIPYFSPSSPKITVSGPPLEAQRAAEALKSLLPSACIRISPCPSSPQDEPLVREMFLQALFSDQKGLAPKLAEAYLREARKAKTCELRITVSSGGKLIYGGPWDEEVLTSLFEEKSEPSAPPFPSWEEPDS